MPINVLGNPSYHDKNNIDTSLFLQKPYLRTNYIEANIEEDIDLKNQHRIKNLPFPISIGEAASKDYVDGAVIIGVNESLLLRLHPDTMSEIGKLNEIDSIILTSSITSPWTTMVIPTKSYVDNLFNDPSIIKNTEHIDLNERNNTNARFIQVNQWPQIDSRLTPKLYVDYVIDKSSLIKLDPDEKLDLDNQDSISLNSTLTSPKTKIEIPTKAYIDSLHEENERSRRDLGIDFYEESSDLTKNNQDNDFNDKKLTNLDSVTVNRNPSLDNELSNKKYIDGELDKNTIVRFNQTLQNFLKVSIANDTYNLTK